MTERIIEKTIEFDADIETVWRAITDEKELAQWFGDDARLEPVVGGDGAMIWHDHGSFAMRVEEVSRPGRLVWSWLHEDGVPFDPEKATRVEWNLSEREDGGTTLYLRESGFRTDLHHQQNTDGWNEELGELVQFLSA